MAPEAAVAAARGDQQPARARLGRDVGIAVPVEVGNQRENGDLRTERDGRCRSEGAVTVAEQDENVAADGRLDQEIQLAVVVYVGQRDLRETAVRVSVREVVVLGADGRVA